MIQEAHKCSCYSEADQKENCFVKKFSWLCDDINPPAFVISLAFSSYTWRNIRSWCCSSANAGRTCETSRNLNCCFIVDAPHPKSKVTFIKSRISTISLPSPGHFESIPAFLRRNWTHILKQSLLSSVGRLLVLLVPMTLPRFCRISQDLNGLLIVSEN